MHREDTAEELNKRLLEREGQPEMRAKTKEDTATGSDDSQYNSTSSKYIVTATHQGKACCIYPVQIILLYNTTVQQ